MSEFIPYIFLALSIGAICTAIAIPIIIAFCQKYGYYDQPGRRKVHTKAVPRLGGLSFLPALAISFSVTMLLYYEKTQSYPFFTYAAIMMILGAAIIYIVGLLDDILDLPASTKFLILLVASAFMPFCHLMVSDLHGLFGIGQLPLWMSYVLTVLIIMTVVNAINLIDGIDGLASGISIIILAFFTHAFLTRGSLTFSIVSAGLLGAVAVFFCFNVFGQVGRMKLFMGDAGSLILGYVMAYLAIKHQLVCERDLYFDGNSLMLTYSVFIVPVFDLVRVFFTRLLCHQPVFKADKRHIHHVLMSYGFSMRQTLVCILLLVLLMIGLNFALDTMDMTFTWIFAADVIVFSCFFLLMKPVCGVLRKVIVMNHR